MEDLGFCVNCLRLSGNFYKSFPVPKADIFTLACLCLFSHQWIVLFRLLNGNEIFQKKFTNPF